MKIKLIFLVSILFLFIGCKDSDSDNNRLEVSVSTFDIGSEETSLKVTITSSSAWTVNSNAQWCAPDKQGGNSNSELTLYVNSNNGQGVRTATVTITSGELKKTIVITQQQVVLTENYHYKIPVIFHVLYKNQNDQYQYVAKGRLEEILAVCNKLYQRKINTSSTDINIEFVMATIDPDGKALSEPGVERIQWQTPEMDCDEFMQSNSEQNTNLLWDTDQYINIMLYTFTDDNVLGISHLPYTLSTNTLEGLIQLNSIPSHSDLKYPYCVSINNSYIYIQSDEEYYRPADVTVTLAHELGHYLGLFHAFSEDDDGNTDLCLDTDYCTDTPTYNRTEYTAWLNGLSDSEFYLGNVIKRKNCSGTEFISYNIMDYGFSNSNLFTQNQKERIRNVLTYSPLIPGPKNRPKGYSSGGPIDLPIRTMK